MDSPSVRTHVGSSISLAQPRICTPRSSAYVAPVSSRQVRRGSRRRFTAFCDFAYVQKAILSSSSVYHIATRCGAPDGLIVATARVLPLSRKLAISSSLIRIWSRRLIRYAVPPLPGWRAPIAPVRWSITPCTVYDAPSSELSALPLCAPRHSAPVDRHMRAAGACEWLAIPAAPALFQA